MIDQLWALYVGQRFPRIMLYLTVFLFVAFYGVFNDLVLGRSIEQVTKEAVGFAVILTVLSVGLYVAIGPSLVERNVSSGDVDDVERRFVLEMQSAAHIGGLIARTRMQREFILVELRNLAAEFAMEYKRYGEPMRPDYGEPFIIQEEYRIGKMLSVGAGGTMAIAFLLELFVQQTALVTNFWISTLVAFSITALEFLIVRGTFATTLGRSDKGSKLMRALGRTASILSILMLGVLLLARAAPESFGSVALPALVLLNLALPASAAWMSVMSERFLWSYRLVDLINTARQHLERLEYELHRLEINQEEVVRSRAEQTSIPITGIAHTSPHTPST